MSILSRDSNGAVLRRLAQNVLVTIALLCTASAQSPLFQTIEEAPIGDRFAGPLSVAVGDFNGDGVPDLVVADSEGAQLVVHLGAGGGRFQPGIRTPLEARPSQITLADLDGDGKLDIAAACANPDMTLALKGNGDGTLQRPVRIPAPSASKAIFAADLNGDGILDLAVGQPRSILLFFGAGGQYVSDAFFSGLGVPPATGRLIGPDDGRAGAAPVAVISFGYAQHRFGEIAKAIGQPILINNNPFTIAGVAAPDFFGVNPAGPQDFYLPMHASL